MAALRADMAAGSRSRSSLHQGYEAGERWCAAWMRPYCEQWQQLWKAVRDRGGPATVRVRKLKAHASTLATDVAPKCHPPSPRESPGDPLPKGAIPASSR